MGEAQGIFKTRSKICRLGKTLFFQSKQTLFVKGRRIPEPFCLVDMGVQFGETIEVKLAEGAVVGLDEVRKQVQRELDE